MEMEEAQYKKMIRIIASRLSFAVKAGTPNATKITETTTMKRRTTRVSTINFAQKYVAVETPAT